MKSGPSIISQDLVVEGDLITDGEVHVEGQLRGKLNAHSVTLGEAANIQGEIRAVDVVVRGTVTGDIWGERVQLAQTAHVEGSIVSRSISMDAGAFFQGTCHHSDNPLDQISQDAKPSLMLAQSADTQVTPIELTEEGTAAKDKKVAAASR